MPEEKKPDYLLTINEVAGILKVHRKTVERYIREGKLPATRPNSEWRPARNHQGSNRK